MKLRLPRSPLAALALAALCALPAGADTIHLVDGTSLNDVDVLTETLAGVTFKQKGKSGDQRVDPDQVLRIEYRRLPRLIDEAETLVADGAIADGVTRLDEFAESVFSGENRRDRQAWAPAHALDRAIHLRMSLGDLDGVIRTADLLMEKRPNSRHMPGAALSKAEAQHLQDKGAAARATLDALGEAIASKGLSERWSLELQLARIEEDDALKGSAKRDRLIEIAGQAGGRFPTVRNRARVLEGETYLEGDRKDFDSARKIFDSIVADPKADEPTLAGAYTGLGDCLFHTAAESIKSGADASADLREALLAYMRVVVNHQDQTRYVAKAMFFAGRVFDYLGDDNSKTNARRLYSAVIQNYPSSGWAQEARNYRK